tara:strand:+ start:163 stop:678 length:516 start_codon:yes stop_codon:yes gene_type:complete
MKVYDKILLILTVALFYNCNEKQNRVETSNIKIAEVKTETSKTLEKLESDKIIGKYYVDSFYHYLKSGFELKIKKPKDDFMLYTFEFKNDGKVIFKDLTEFYDCGNGILSIENGNWKSNGNGIYELTFDGEYALESKFHTVSEYQLVDLKNGNLRMKLIKVIENKKKLAWE